MVSRWAYCSPFAVGCGLSAANRSHLLSVRRILLEVDRLSKRCLGEPQQPSPLSFGLWRGGFI